MKGATLWLPKMKKLLQKREATSLVLDETGASPQLGTRLCGERWRSRGGTSAGREVAVLPGPSGGRRKSERRRKEQRVSLVAGWSGGGGGTGGAICKAEGSWRLWSGGV